MGITVFKDSADSDRTYLRVTRAFNGEEQQRYVRIESDDPAGMERAMQEARRIDEVLQQWQQERRRSLAFAGQGLISEDGSIVGLQMQKRQRDGRQASLEFKIRVKNPDQPAIFKSVSINRYGLDKAFSLAIEKICQMREISTDSKAYVKMQQALPVYRKRFEELNRQTPATSYPLNFWLGAFSPFLKRG